MLDTFLRFDTYLFHVLNGTIANPVFDIVMPFVTDVRNFYPVYVLLFVVLLWKGGRTGRWCAAALALTVLISDPLNSRVIKEMVMRIRPCATLSDVRLLVPCGAGKSFPSSHAVNNFAAAAVIGYYFRKYAPIAYLVASVVAFSRIYVGVHYPADVIGGALIGTLVAAAVVWGMEAIRGRFEARAAVAEPVTSSRPRWRRRR